MLIDSHCHLLHRRYQEEEPPLNGRQLLKEAQQAGISSCIAIACKRQEWEEYLTFAAQNAPHIGVAAGIHPHNAGEGGLVTAQELETLARNPHTVALGETGLDYFYDKAPRAAQRQSFHLHLQAARAAGLPVVVHTRDAEEDTLAILAEHPGVPFVLHCFTGSAAMAHAAVGKGGYISFSGILTFKKSQGLRDIAATLPRERVLIETDAPYLAPEPFRSRRNSPALLRYTAEMLAKVWQCSPTEAAQITVANTRRLFPRLPIA